MNAEPATSQGDSRDLVGDEGSETSHASESNPTSPGRIGPSSTDLDRARLLAAIDEATRKGDVDEASSLLAKLMAPTASVERHDEQEHVS